MQQCPNCQGTQQQGKFCAKCGTETVAITQIVESTVVATTPLATPVQPQVQVTQKSQPTQSDHVEKLKQISNGYFGHFMELLKKPTQALTMSTSFMYSIISFILYLLVISFTIFSMINRTYKSTIGMFSDESMPISVMFGIMFIIGIFTIVAILALFVLAKIFAGKASFGQLFGQVMNFYPVLIAISVVAFVLQLIGANGFSILLVIFAIFIGVLLLPLYVIVHVLQENPHKVDTYHVYIMLAGVIAIVLYLVLNSLVSSAIDELMNSLDLFSW